MCAPRQKRVYTLRDKVLNNSAASHCREPLMDRPLLKRPSALLPVAMSIGALAVVIGYAVMFGTARQPDEGAAAHIWQLLMAGQLPVVAFFAIKWLPSE